jgi:hypothetical protein
MSDFNWGIALLIWLTGISILIGFLIYFVTHIYADTDDILPQFQRDRIPCYTPNEYEFSHYRCYIT